MIRFLFYRSIRSSSDSAPVLSGSIWFLLINQVPIEICSENNRFACFAKCISNKLILNLSEIFFKIKIPLVFCWHVRYWQFKPCLQISEFCLKSWKLSRGFWLIASLHCILNITLCNRLREYKFLVPDF